MVVRDPALDVLEDELELLLAIVSEDLAQHTGASRHRNVTADSRHDHLDRAHVVRGETRFQIVELNLAVFCHTVEEASRTNSTTALLSERTRETHPDFVSLSDIYIYIYFTLQHCNITALQAKRAMPSGV